MSATAPPFEIRHRETGERLHRFETASLAEASLAGLYFCHADLAGVDLTGADLAGAICRATDLRGSAWTALRWLATAGGVPL